MMCNYQIAKLVAKCEVLFERLHGLLELFGLLVGHAHLEIAFGLLADAHGTFAGIEAFVVEGEGFLEVAFLLEIHRLLLVHPDQLFADLFVYRVQFLVQCLLQGRLVVFLCAGHVPLSLLAQSQTHVRGCLTLRVLLLLRYP